MKREFLPYEKALIVIGYATLVLGAIATVFLAFTTIYVPKMAYMSGEYYNVGKEFSPAGLAYTIGTLIGSIAIYAASLCIANTSMNVRNIANGTSLNQTEEVNVIDSDKEVSVSKALGYTLFIILAIIVLATIFFGS
jgi:hypothetical protein